MKSVIVGPYPAPAACVLAPVLAPVARAAVFGSGGPPFRLPRPRLRCEPRPRLGAMANAKAAAKAAARETLAWSNDDDGVARRCEELLAAGALVASSA